MPVPIAMPDVGTERATVSLWFVNAGETVYAGDRIVEILIPGATFDVPAPVSGRLLDRSVFPGDSLEPGQTLGHLEPDPDD